MICKTKIKHTCADHTFSACTVFESTPNSQSKLVDETCLDQEMVDQDQYNQLEDIWSEIDLSEMGEKCLEFVETDEGKIIVKSVLLKFEEVICELQDKIEALENRQICDIPITECVTDFNCLIGTCDNTILTLGDWMTAVQNKICEQ